MMLCSVVTIVYNRNEHLQNLVRGLLKGEQQPSELIVVDIDHTVQGIDYGGLNVTVVHQDKPDAHLPLAKARNAGVRTARSEKILLLDVDCIPHFNFISQFCAYLDQYSDALLMATPRYLEQTVETPINFDVLEQGSAFHPHRPKPQLPIERCQQYELFWSLCFALTRPTFERIGGFDEDYIGYGAEDTDFAFKAREMGVPFYLADVWAYHQQHAIYRPPLNRLDDIIVNSNIFYKKWERWPMEGWLNEFAQLDLIQWQEQQQNNIEKIKSPSEELLKRCFFPNAPFV
jgi:GT2 family glycosyltransferase